MAAAFHPELTADHRLHARFVELVGDRGHDHRAQEA
jgi:glutamine amidotransferase PdxT